MKVKERNVHLENEKLGRKVEDFHQRDKTFTEQ
jgi:hypothetical protein